MPLPSFTEYTDALLQGLGTALTDPLLRRGTLCLRAPGLPVVHGGTYALTFEVVTEEGKYALRCFHKELDALPLRYEGITRYLGRIHSPHFADCQFQPDGIRTESGSYPVVRMDWVDGPNLATFVAEHRHDAKTLLELRFALRRLARHLRAKHVAHGDVQPSNLIVQDGLQLRLIDYDGLYVPGLAPLCSAELGQRNFQHPGRRARHFDEGIDAFPFALLDLALHALCIRPELWELTGSGPDAFLLRAADFADPARSAVFALLGGIPGLEQRVRNLAAICVSPYEAVPAFEDFMAGRAIPAQQVELSGGTTLPEPAASRVAGAVVDASDFAQCCRHVGDRVELIGRIVRVVPSDPTSPAPACLRVEFADRACDMACLKIWPDAISRLAEVPDDGWAGQWVSAIGLVEPVRSDNGVRGQKDVSISIEEPGQLQRLSEGEANYRLRSQGVVTGRAADPAGRVRTDPVVPVAVPTPVLETTRPRRHDTVIINRDVPVVLPPPKARAPRRPGWLPWAVAAVVLAGAAFLLLTMDAGHELSTEEIPVVEVAPSPTDAEAPVTLITRTGAPEVATRPVPELMLSQGLPPEAESVATVAGSLSLVDRADGRCRLIALPGDRVVPDLCEPHIVLAHRAVYRDRDVIVGFTRCDEPEAPCSRQRPFWLELRADAPPEVRRIDGLWAGSNPPLVIASADGVQVDLGLWDGEQRRVTLTGTGNLRVAREPESIRALDRADCAVVLRSLEACAASPDCSTFALSAERIRPADWSRLVRAYHESTGLDVEAYRTLCVRSCELGLTPSAGLVRDAACRGAKPGQWSAGDPAGGLGR